MVDTEMGEGLIYNIQFSGYLNAANPLSSHKPNLVPIVTKCFKSKLKRPIDY